MPRDFVRFLPNQRVDLPDFTALQRNTRSASRSQLWHLLFGKEAFVDSYVRRTLGGWLVEEDGPPSANVVVNQGGAFGFEVVDGEEQKVIAFGLEGASQQLIDLTGRPVATYTIWIRFVQEQGVIGARVFWNDNTSMEDIDSIETREVVAWDVRAETASPGVEWQRIADVAWNGVTVTNANITMRRNMFFEGDEDAAFAHEWGDGVNDRDADRGAYGTHDMLTWVQAVRRQLADVIGGSDWFTAPASDLAEARAHIDDSTDPHGVSLTQTNLEVIDTLNANYSALGGTGAIVANVLGNISISADAGPALTITQTGTAIAAQGLATQADSGWRHLNPTNALVEFEGNTATFEVHGLCEFGSTGGGTGILRVDPGISQVTIPIGQTLVVQNILFTAGHPQDFGLHGSAFVSAGANHTYDSSGHFGSPGGGAAALGWAALTGFPQGGRMIGNMTARVDVAATDSIQIRLKRTDRVTGVETFFADTGVVAGTGAPNQLLSAAIAVHDVDWGSYVYAVDCTVTTAGGSGGSYVQRANIEWVPVSLYPA